MTPTEKNRAQLQFLTWVRNRYPELYAAAIAKAEGNKNAQLGLVAPETEVPTESFWSKVGGALTGLGTTYLTLKNQRDAMKLNLARAEQGLPPVDAGVTAPVVRTEIDLPPDVVSKMTQSAGMQVNKMLLFGGAAIIAIMLFMNRK